VNNEPGPHRQQRGVRRVRSRSWVSVCQAIGLTPRRPSRDHCGPEPGAAQPRSSTPSPSASPTPLPKAARGRPGSAIVEEHDRDAQIVRPSTTLANVTSPSTWLAGCWPLWSPPRPCRTARYPGRYRGIWSVQACSRLAERSRRPLSWLSRPGAVVPDL